MKIAREHLSSLEALGYTPDEARFLYIVATHSGYFMARQFLYCCGAKWGARSQRFTRKLQSRGHGLWREYPYTGGVYHLASKLLYRVIDKESLRNHRRHSVDFIRTRLVQLDFVLANQAHQYLETESERVAYFCDTLGVRRNDLPAKSYASSGEAGPTLRYFVDKFPLFLDDADSPAGPRPTLSYIDAGEATLGGFRRHLRSYQQLFASLSDFRFLYISNSSAHFIAAERHFQSFLARTVEPQADAFQEICRYFRLRSAWEQKRYASLSNDDIEWLREAKRRLKGPDTEALYAAWARGELPEGTLAAQTSALPPTSHRFDFGVCLVPSNPVATGELGRAP